MGTQPESQIDDGSAMKAFVENRHVTKRYERNPIYDLQVEY
jgi:hypothetical protein